MDDNSCVEERRCHLPWSLGERQVCDLAFVHFFASSCFVRMPEKDTLRMRVLFWRTAPRYHFAYFPYPTFPTFPFTDTDAPGCQARPPAFSSSLVLTLDWRQALVTLLHFSTVLIYGQYV